MSRTIPLIFACLLAWAPRAAAQDQQPVPQDAQSMQAPVEEVQPAPEEEQGRPWVDEGQQGATTEGGEPEQGAVIEDGGSGSGSAAPTEPVRKGLQVQLSLGLSDCLGKLCGDPPSDGNYEGTSIGIGGELSGWFRPIEYVSLGLTLHYNLIAVDDVPFIDNSWSYFIVDAGARVHPLKSGPIDVFIGPTFGYTWFNTSAEGDGGFSDQDITGFTLGGELGGEFYIMPQISVGALFRFLYPFWSESCYDYDIAGFGADSGCDDIDDLDDLDPTFAASDLPTMFYIGASASYHMQL